MATLKDPRPSEIILLIEVAETSVRYDKLTKVPLYAHYRIPEVWVFDLVANTVDVHRSPSVGAYASNETLLAGAGAVLECAGVRIAVDEILAKA